MADGCGYVCKMLVLLLVSMVLTMMICFQLLYIFGPIHYVVYMADTALATYAYYVICSLCFWFSICLMLKHKIIGQVPIVSIGFKIKTDPS